MDAFPEKIRPDPTARAPDIPLLPRVPEGHRRTGEHEAVCRKLLHGEGVAELDCERVADALAGEHERAALAGPALVLQGSHVHGRGLAALVEPDSLYLSFHSRNGLDPCPLDAGLAGA